MTPEQWVQVRHFYETALEQAVETQPLYLQAHCQDVFVRTTVTQMLADREQLHGWLETPLLVVPTLRDDALQDALGRRIGAYVLERELGRGGMGVVYLAARADDVYQKEVAIKLLWPGWPEDQKRFQRERQILADLDHPGIARLLDGNVTAEGWPYIVMEYVAGLPITEYCDQHWLDCTARVQLLIKVCEAVEYAHQHRVIHRDLKPANLLVTAEGAPRLLDFGIAKLLDTEFPTKFTLSTQTGRHAMTPDYASPEQMRGEEITPASDVYSLGVLLYELLTGQRPFRLDDKPLHEAVRIVSEDDPPRPSASVTASVAALSGDGSSLPTLTPEGRSQLREGSVTRLRSRLQGDLDNIVGRALGKTPAARYPTVAALRADLERHLRHEPVTAREPTFTYRAQRFVRRHRLGVTVAALLLLGLFLALGTALWQAHTARQEARQTRRLLYLSEMRQAGLDLAEGNYGRLRATLERWRAAPEAEDWRGFEWFYLWRQAHREQLELWHNGLIYAVAWSPDGQILAAACDDGQIRFWDAVTGQQKRALKHSTQRVIAVAWSPNGQHLASAGEDQQLRLWDAATGQELWHAEVGGPTEFSLAFAPDGATLAASAETSLALFQTATGQRLFQLTMFRAFQKVAFFPDGRRLATSGQDQMVRTWDATTGRQLKAVWGHPDSFVHSVAVSPDGRWVASGGNDQVGSGKGARLWEADTLQARRVFVGHDGSVRGLAFSPDGTKLVTGSADRLVKLWDVASGRELQIWRGHTNRIRDAAFAPDGRRIATCSDDGTVRIWNVDGTTEPVDVLAGHSGTITPTVIAPDGTTVATGSADHLIKLWDLPTGRLRKTLTEHSESVLALAFAPDGQTLVTGGADETIRFWSTNTGQMVDLISMPTAALAFTPTGLPLHTFSRQGTVELREVETGQPRLTLSQAGLGVTGMEYTADGQHLVTINRQGQGRVWEAATLRPLMQWMGDPSGLLFLTISAAGKIIVTEGRAQETEGWDGVSGKRLYRLPHRYNAGGAMRLSTDGRWLLTGGLETAKQNALLREGTTGHIQATLQGHTSTVTVGDLSPDGNWIATGSDNGEVKLWAVATRRVVHTLSPGARAESLRFSPDSRRLAVGTTDQVVRLYEVQAGQLRQTVTGFADAVVQVVFAPDGRRLLSRDVEGWVYLHDLATGKVIVRRHGTGVGGGVSALAYSPDSKRIVAGGWHSPAVWDVTPQQQVLVLKGHQDRVWTVACAPDGKTIATTSSDKTARLWDAQTGQERFRLAGHNTAVTALAYAPNSQLVATGGDDRTVKLWDVATGREVRTLTGHADQVLSVVFAPDGQRIAAGGADFTVRVWDVATGQELLTLRGHTDEVWSVAFAPDGKTLVSGSWDKTARIWRGATATDLASHRHQP